MTFMKFSGLLIVGAAMLLIPASQNVGQTLVYLAALIGGVVLVFKG